VWREQGSRHVAWCPEGGLMLAIFQVPNKFFEADGRVVDARARTGTRPGGIPARGERGSRSALADKGQGGARPHSVSYAGLTRVCINLRESLANKMDCRVKPGRRVSPRQVRRSHQKLIDGAGAEAPLPDRPDDERLAAAHVAGGKHFWQRGLIICGVGAHIAARVEVDAER